MKVLIIGKGGREHALAWKIKQSPLLTELYTAPGGIQDLSIAVDITDITGLADFAEQHQIDLTIVGPEQYLADGIADEFQKRGLKIFAPTKAAARIESSKDYAKHLMQKYHIPTADYETFTDYDSAQKYLESKSAPIVIKEDGLKAGKGVVVAMSLDEAETALKDAFSVPNKVVIEEYMQGFEFSIIALACRDIVIPLEIAQDHKRAGDGDTGANTGGMGVYSPVDKITPEIAEDTVQKILKPMLNALIQEGTPFTGFLFGGIMLTADGVKTIEFNARFGDPEAEVLLPRLKSDLLEVIVNLLNGKTAKLEWDSRYAVSVVLASEGYPQSSTTGAEIDCPDNLESLIFHMGTKKQDGVLLTNGGRVLAVTAFGDDLKQAVRNAYKDVEKIKCDKLFYRKDIGAKA